MFQEIENLSAAQQRAIPALLTSTTLVEAANQARVGERSLRRWLKEDRNFQREYNRARREVVNHAVTRLQRLTTMATESLECMLKDQGPPTVARVGAVRTAFDYAYRGIEFKALQVRLEEVEEKLSALPPDSVH